MRKLTVELPALAIISAVVLIAFVPRKVIADQPTIATPQVADDNPILAMLRARVAQDPNHSDSWRLIGKLEASRGNQSEALNALQRALAIDPTNAAAHFDLGHMLLAAGDTAGAKQHFHQCISAAPLSNYTSEIYAAGLVVRPTNIRPHAPEKNPFSLAVAKNPSASQPTPTQTVGYQIQTFDGAEEFEERFQELASDADPALKRLRVFLETGVLYNSNVSLTPISRGLAPSDAASFQGFMNPEIEWIAVQRGAWRTGPLARGFFAVNEATQSEFDLSSFQPGAFLERDLTVGSSEWIPRLEYVFSLDLLDGDQFGNRHSITASTIIIRPDLDVIYTYLTTSFAEFRDDGADPAISSLDGPAITAGFSRFFQTERARLPQYSLGFDVESIDTEGADFRYRSVAAHGDVTCRLRERLQFIPSWGVGYRDYYAFTGAIDRDELIWRIAGKLSWNVNDHVTLSWVANHNRFASDNEDFDSERTEGGVVLTFNR